MRSLPNARVLSAASGITRMAPSEVVVVPYGFLFTPTERHSREWCGVPLEVGLEHLVGDGWRYRTPHQLDPMELRR